MTPVPQFVGPIYCDTAHMFMGFHEPVNTITNAAILIAAWFAYRHVKHSGVGFSAGLIVLLTLLVGVGVGSAFVARLEDPMGAHPRYAAGRAVPPGADGIVDSPTLRLGGGRRRSGADGTRVGRRGWLFRPRLGAITPALRFAPMFATVAVTGVVMVAGSWAKYGRATGMLGVTIVAIGISAAFFRSIDLVVCPYVPFGTHFLWHIGLSTAACLGIF